MSPLADWDLLDLFLARKDQAAFSELVRRHGPRVLGACRRVLRDADRAQDAFQATFLLLARKGASLRRTGRMDSWLYNVAVHVSLDAKKSAMRRRMHEREAISERTRPDADPEAWERLRPILDEELVHLPDRYRQPLISCYLDGKTVEQAAEDLGCPVGTLATRLFRGRELLRTRLVQRGAAVTGAALGVVLAAHAVPAVKLSSALVAWTSQAAAEGMAVGIVSAQVGALVNGGMKAMMIAKAKAVSAIAAVGIVVGGGGGALAVHALKGQEPAKPTVVETARGGSKDELSAKTLEGVLRAVKPQADEWLWLKVPWITDLWTARQKASEEDKPIFYFGTGGAGFNDPLGVC